MFIITYHAFKALGLQLCVKQHICNFLNIPGTFLLPQGLCTYLPGGCRALTSLLSAQWLIAVKPTILLCFRTPSAPVLVNLP